MEAQCQTCWKSIRGHGATQGEDRCAAAEGHFGRIRPSHTERIDGTVTLDSRLAMSRTSVAFLV